MRKQPLLVAVLLFALASWAASCPERAVEPVDVDCGRQLFVDDCLIESTNGVVRHWNRPTKLESPIIRPTADGGTRIGGCTVATDGGLWWDPTVGKFRLWYEDNWKGDMRYAESSDGLVWEYPDLGHVKGTNRVFADGDRNARLDTWSVSPDYAAANPYSRWLMLTSYSFGYERGDDHLFVSADGKSFAHLGISGWSGDRTTLYYDPFLAKWVFSLRDARRNVGRCRRFHVQDEFKPNPVPYGWEKPKKPLPPEKLRKMEAPDKWTELELDYAAGCETGGRRCALYSFTAAPYESLMLGVMEVLHAEPGDNRDCEEKGLPKQTALRFSFSRDGRAYHPSPEEAIRPCGWGSGKWDTGYLSAVGGVCVIKDEKLWFYYSAVRGDAEKRRGIVGKEKHRNQGMYYNGAIGAATLRRDGFCGMVADGNGEIVTRPLAFTGSHLFVNAECLFGEVAAEVLDETGAAVSGFSAADCRGLKYVDRTKAELSFAGGTLDALKDRNVRLRFKLHCATLYSFWVSPSARGESRGYVAGGGPAYRGLRDL